jgi:predicted molibdopterin-dependent oxidoreductase YjgC
MQELFTDVQNLLVVGPSIFRNAAIASYWINHSRLYRESRIVVISTEHYELCDRAVLWLKPNDGTTEQLVDAIAAEVLNLGLVQNKAAEVEGFAALRDRLAAIDVEAVAQVTGVPARQIREAAAVFVTGAIELSETPSLRSGAIYHTVAHQGAGKNEATYGDAEGIAAALDNLALLTGNVGRAGGGVAALRGPANYQGATDMGLTPHFLPGGFDVADSVARGALEAAWSTRWLDAAQTTPLPSTPGFGIDELADAIERGEIRAAFVESGFATRETVANTRVYEALKSLDFLAVISAYESPLTAIADVVLPLALNLEKDGTFTSFDRTVQRVRAAVPAMGEARTVGAIVADIAGQFGYDLTYQHPGVVMNEIVQLVPGYAGVSYARLERGGIVTPTEAHDSVKILRSPNGVPGELKPRFSTPA